MMGTVHLLPGTTQSSVAAKGDYDAEGMATITISEFDRKRLGVPLRRAA